MGQAARAEIGDDEPVRLADAAGLFFPHGGMTLSALRTEARKGNLVIERIAGKDFVTRRAIDEMRARCREQGSRHGSKSAPKPEGTESGSSETAKRIAERDALLTRLETPNSRYANTSRTKAKHQTPASISHLRPGSHR